MREPAGRTRFPTTNWGRVLAAADTGSAARDPLAELCAAYWYPLYAFARRSGTDPDHARDLTQGFFTRLLEKRDLSDVAPERGRFRSWLLASLRHYMANEWDRERALKRGGQATMLPVDILDAEARYRREPGPELAAERLYDRRWALLILERALERLRDRHREPDQLRLFERLKPLLALPEAEGTAALALELDLSPGALKTRLSRLRQRLWSQVRSEIAETVDDPGQVDGELRYLISVVAMEMEP